jgi:hypothetical protein
MTVRSAMRSRQRGALNLVWVMVLSGLCAAVAMALLFSVRHERNLFAETWNRAGAGAVSRQALGLANKSVAGAPLRKCMVDGRRVVSNTDCSDSNPSSKLIEIHDTQGFDAPRPAAAAAAAPTSDPVLDKMIEKQLH